MKQGSNPSSFVRVDVLALGSCDDGNPPDGPPSVVKTPPASEPSMYVNLQRRIKVRIEEEGEGEGVRVCKVLLVGSC